MKIGILGAGNVGSALGAAWLRHKHAIMFGSRDPVQGAARSGSAAEAAQFGEVVVIALPWQAAHDLLPSLALDGKTVVDCTNAPRAALASQGFNSAAEALQARSPGARFVKAFNTTGFNNMNHAQYAAGRVAMFFCGDHADAKSTVRDLITEVGFEPCDLGPLSNRG